MKRRRFLTTLAAGAGAVMSSTGCENKEAVKTKTTDLTGVDTIREPARDIPILATTDVLVVGGGPAGVAAAVSAGRAGADVVLTERYNHLGGLWTGGLVLPLLSTHAIDESGKFKRVLYGIGGEIEQKLRDMGMAIRDYNTIIDPEAGKYVMEEMVKEAGVRMLYHAWAGNVIVENDHIKAVLVETKSGRGAIVAKMIVDCTGDGDIYHLAGESYRTMKYEVGLVHRLGNTHLVDKTKPGYKELNIGKSTPIEGVNWVNMTTGDYQDVLDAWNLSHMQQQYRLDIWETFKKIKSTPGYEKLYVLDTASQLGTRISRLLNGEYRLTLQDSMTFKSFKDVVGISGAWTTIPYQGKRVPMKKRPLWQIPLRSLIPSNTQNLLVAGRCFDFEESLFQDTRIIGTCLITGHAAGAAAAIAAKNNTTAKSVDVPQVQNLLREQKANLG